MTSCYRERALKVHVKRCRRFLVATALPLGLLVMAQPTTGQDGEGPTPAAGDAGAADDEGSGTAIVRVMTDPPFTGDATFFLTGIPAGELTLTSDGKGSLTATGLASGTHVSKLSQIDPEVAAAGYSLTDVRCDDGGSAEPSIGKLENSAAILRVEDQEVVTCEFVLSESVKPTRARVDCICPKEGRWVAQNLEGEMDCKGAFVLSRKLKPVRDNGVIFVMEDDCSSLFGDSMTKQEEDVLMTRVDGCGYRGTIDGEEEGIDMVIDVVWTIESEEHITGEMSSSTSQMGITCDLYRPFELTFDKPLGEKDSQKWRQRALRKVEEMK